MPASLRLAGSGVNAVGGTLEKGRAGCADYDEGLGFIDCFDDSISEGSHTTQHSYFAGRQ